MVSRGDWTRSLRIITSVEPISRSKNPEVQLFQAQEVARKISHALTLILHSLLDVYFWSKTEYCIRWAFCMIHSGWPYILIHGFISPLSFYKHTTQVFSCFWQGIILTSPSVFRESIFLRRAFHKLARRRECANYQMAIYGITCPDWDIQSFVKWVGHGSREQVVEHNIITACLISGSEISLKLLGRRERIIIKDCLERQNLYWWGNC